MKLVGIEISVCSLLDNFFFQQSIRVFHFQLVVHHQLLDILSEILKHLKLCLVVILEFGHHLLVLRRKLGLNFGELINSFFNIFLQKFFVGGNDKYLDWREGTEETLVEEVLLVHVGPGLVNDYLLLGHDVGINLRDKRN